MVAIRRSATLVFCEPNGRVGDSMPALEREGFEVLVAFGGTQQNVGVLGLLSVRQS